MTADPAPPAGSMPGDAATSTGPGAYILQPMPAGTAALTRDAAGHLQVHVNMFGLTPGSAHDVAVEGQNGRQVMLPALTANSAGQADILLSSAGTIAWLPPLSRLVIRLGSIGDESGGSLPAAEPIAETGPLPTYPGGVFALHAVTYGSSGATPSQPAGRATITFNAAAHTLAVSVTATGLTPGPHAAHIHLGSCQNQGPVKYMLPDFVADANGNITGQTRVAAGVASVPGPGSWYLNLHQGGMSQILANGVPTLAFRPLLCTDITSFATAGGSPSASPPAATSSPPMTLPSGTPGSSPPMTGPAGSPVPSPASQPTHW